MDRYSALRRIFCGRARYFIYFSQRIGDSAVHNRESIKKYIKRQWCFSENKAFKTLECL